MAWLKRVPRWLLEVLVVVVLLWAVHAYQARELAQGAAPEFTLSDLDGGVWTRARLSGKPTLVVFWAPWCGVCRAMGSNVSYVKALSGDGAQVISIASDYRSVDEVRRYAAEHQLDYPVLLGARDAARAFHVRAYPTVFVLDESGQIRSSMVGYATTLGMYLRL
ncbi:MAG TPA: TlpA disulfide reductase family protein [Polyangiales bacterium]